MNSEPHTWNVKRDVDLSHLLMTLMTLGAFFGWALHQEARFVAAESAITQLKGNQAEILNLINQQHTETRQDIKDVSAKLDALIGRRQK
jgi:hypothetical protein